MARWVLAADAAPPGVRDPSARACDWHRGRTSAPAPATDPRAAGDPFFTIRKVGRYQAATELRGAGPDRGIEATRNKGDWHCGGGLRVNAARRRIASAAGAATITVVLACWADALLARLRPGTAVLDRRSELPDARGDLRPEWPDLPGCAAHLRDLFGHGRLCRLDFRVVRRARLPLRHAPT